MVKTPQPHILLAEDEPHTRLALSLILRKASYRCTLVSDGYQALQHATSRETRRDPFSLLVIDVEMPVLTGIDLLDELRRRHLQLPTLIISGYHYRAALEACGQNAVAYLEKPFDPLEFLWHVERLVAGPPQSDASNDGRIE